MKQVIDNPIKLIEFSNNLNKINKELEESEENILYNKHFVHSGDCNHNNNNFSNHRINNINKCILIVNVMSS